MHSERMRLGRIALILLILCSALLSQAAAAADFTHSHQHTPTHCCGVCHTGHLPLVQASGGPRLFQPSPVVHWHVASDDLHELLEPLLLVSSSRAPPA